MKRHISHKTTHTIAPVDVEEISGSTIRVYSTVANVMQNVVQVTDLPSNSAH
jgi:hypothetical protein